MKYRVKVSTNRSPEPLVVNYDSADEAYTAYNRIRAGRPFEVPGYPSIMPSEVSGVVMETPRQIIITPKPVQASIRDALSGISQE